MRAIVQLTYKSEAIQTEIASRGGIPLLASVLSSTTTNAKQMMASAVLCSLAANAVAQLTENSHDNQMAFAEAGVISPLVVMLSAPNAQVGTAPSALAGLQSLHHTVTQPVLRRYRATLPPCRALPV